MTEWIDVAVYAALTVALWFLLPAWAAKFTVLYVHDRNPEWLRQHPNVEQALRAYPMLNLVWFGWGLVSLGLLLIAPSGVGPPMFVTFTENTPRWEVLKDLNSALLMIGAVVIVGMWAGFTLWLRKVPCANRRHATLTPRTLDAMVPRMVRVFTYAGVAAVLLAWIVVAFIDASTTPKFWGRFAAFVGVIGAIGLVVSCSVRRPPHVMDRLFGPSYRTDEVRFAFAMLLLPPIGGAVRLYEEITHTTVPDLNRAMHLGIAMLVAFWVWRLTRYTAGTGGAGEAGAATLSPDRTVERPGTIRRLLHREISMKPVLRSLVSLGLLFSVVFAQGQNLVGQWQGTLSLGPGLRLVVVIAANAAGGGYTATFYSIDQSPQPIPATVTAQGGAVRIAIAVAGITFDGKLSPDGNSIVGTFTQGQGSAPMTLVRASGDAAFPLPAPPKTLAADAPMVFEVATIKPSPPDRPGIGITMKPPDVITIGTSLSYLMGFAYDMHAKQIVGGPPWVESEKFDITGRPQAPGVPSLPQFRALLRNLIEERFKLKTHREKRNLPAYALVVAGTPKMARNDTNPNGPPGAGFKAPGAMSVFNATMSDFATTMQGNVLDRPVLDRTGLQGRFDFTLNWTPDESQFRGMGITIPPPAADATLPGLFTAIQEQIGLKFESVTAPVEVIVIDSAERPTN